MLGPVSLLVTRVRPLKEVERDTILAALAQNGQNQAKTAAQLGIGVVTLYRKLKQYAASTPSQGARAPAPK